MKLSEIKKLSQKKKTENSMGKKNIMSYYVWGPCSNILTWILLFTKLSPNNISFLSLVSALIGFLIMCFAKTTGIKILGVVFFAFWCILDCVDGKIARIRKQFSPVGDLWDAAAGYVAMSLMFLGIGICAFNQSEPCSLLFVILGALTSICSLLPRLLMHFKYHGEVNEINDMHSYGFAKQVAFNLSSPDCFVLPFMVISIIFHIECIYVTCYFLLYLAICVYTCAGLLKE